MPASAPDKDVFDDGLNHVVNTVEQITFLDSEPTDYADATTLSGSGGSKLSDLSITASELSIQDDGSGGREIVIPRRGHIADESGSINHIALVNNSTNTLIIYTEHDDGAGNAVSVTVDEAYNLNETTIGYQDFVTA